MYSKQKATLNNLTCDLSPTLIIDDINADIINLYLTPETSIKTFSLSNEFKKTVFKGNSKKEWVKKLREIADILDD